MDWSLTPVDYVFGLLVLILMIRGAVRGFVAEFLGMAAIILGVIVAVLFFGSVSVWLEMLIGKSMWNQIIAFLLLFVAAYLVVKLTEGIFHGAIEKLSLQRLDKVLGFLLGGVEGLLVVFVVLFVLRIQPFFDLDSLLTESFFARVVLPFLSSAVGAAAAGDPAAGDPAAGAPAVNRSD